MNATRDQITALLRQRLSDSAIARHLHCDRHRVTGIRRSLGLPKLPPQPLTLEEKWRSYTRAVDGGHVEWTGERNNQTGTPVMRYRQKAISPAAVAFRIQHGRDPEGYAIADCGKQHCVAPAHVEDTTARTKGREQLRYLTGGAERPAQCRHGHDQQVHGLYERNGTAYCGKCKRLAKAATR